MNTRYYFFSTPWLLLISFCTLLISTELSGGIYIHFLIKGLSVFAPQSITGCTGILILLFAGIRPYKWLKIIGATLLMYSLVLFFGRTFTHTADTIFQVVPVVMFIVFLILWIFFIYYAKKSREYREPK